MNTNRECCSPLLTRIRWLVVLFIAGLLLSGVTAIPLDSEVAWLVKVFGDAGNGPVTVWLGSVHAALQDIAGRHPFVFYGTDWLGFAHVMIAVAFIGAWRDPVRNLWLFDFGLIACALVVPFALVFGAVRGIPWWWRLIDCSFGVFGALPLWFARRAAHALARVQ